MNDITTVAKYLIKKLCLDTNATKATLTQEVTYLEKPIGTYKITIEKVEEANTKETDTFKEAQKEMGQLERALYRDRKTNENTTPNGQPPYPPNTKEK